jgi:hypothetical protein
MLLIGGIACNTQPSTPTSVMSEDGKATASVEQEGFLGTPLPGAQPLGVQVVTRLKAAWKARDPNYKPRTRHVTPNGVPHYTNRLFLESSPYLLQHAHNPLNWYPWGDEAFATARKLGRPVLLSVGYATCHWCHVMEEESFDNEEIACYLSEHYIASFPRIRQHTLSVVRCACNSHGARVVPGAIHIGLWHEGRDGNFFMVSELSDGRLSHEY